MNDANNFDGTVLKSLKSLGNTLRTEKFILRAAIQKKHEFAQQEKRSRDKIKNLMQKINWELTLQNEINKPKEKE